MAKSFFAVCRFFAVCFWVADGKELLCRQLADGKELADGKLADSSSVLRLCALAAAPLPAVVNMLNKREESGEDCTWRGGQSGPTRSMAVRKQVPHRKNTSS